MPAEEVYADRYGGNQTRSLLTGASVSRRLYQNETGGDPWERSNRLKVNFPPALSNCRSKFDTRELSYVSGCGQSITGILRGHSFTRITNKHVVSLQTFQPCVDKFKRLIDLAA